MAPSWPRSPPDSPATGAPTYWSRELVRTRLQLKFIALLAAFALAAGAPSANAGFVNGGFEAGNFNGWSVTPGGLGAVATSASKLSESGSWAPQDGSYFAYIETGAGEGVYTLLSQAFTANAGDSLSFKIFFDAGDYFPYNDNGYARLLDSSNNVVAQLYFKDVLTVGDFGSSGWDTVNYNFATSGTFKLEFGVTNITDNGFPSRVGVDAVSLQSVNPVPAPAGLVLAGSALASLGGYTAIRRRAARARA